MTPHDPPRVIPIPPYPIIPLIAGIDAPTGATSAAVAAVAAVLARTCACVLRCWASGSMPRRVAAAVTAAHGSRGGRMASRRASTVRGRSVWQEHTGSSGLAETIDAWLRGRPERSPEMLIPTGRYKSRYSWVC